VTVLLTMIKTFHCTHLEAAEI